jgi:hypothetical protein
MTKTKTKVKKEKDDDEKFVDSLLTQSKSQSVIHGINLRAPTLATLAILTRADNALVTGKNLSESDVMMHVLVFLYVHSAPIEEVHGASIVSPIAGQNLALERKALELGETLKYKSASDFIKLYEDLVKWLSEHMDLQVEAIPDETNKGKAPNPNE